MTQDGRLTVGVIGAGPVGVALAQALAGAGHILTGITAASPESLERVDAMLPGLDVLTPPQVLERSELVLLTIPDDELQKTIDGFAKASLWRPGQIVAHTSAKFDYTVFEPAAQKGAIPIALHPAMRFTGTSIDVARLKECFFAVAAPSIALPIAQALVIEMGSEPIIIDSSQRAAYAEAFDVATNFSALVVNQAIGLLEEAGIENARLLIAPTIRSAVERALDDGHQPLNPNDVLREEE